jgi:mRNA interferase RelE/StbE
LRAFLRLPADVQRRLAPKIDALAQEPRPRGIKKLADEENLYRLRVGDYRVVYEVRDRELLILIVGVAHRREVYRR